MSLRCIERREGRRMRIGDDQQLEVVHSLHGFRDARHGVAAVAHDDHALEDRPLVDLVFGQVDRVEPARRGDAGRLHVLLARAGRPAGFGRHLVEPRLQPLVGNIPDAAPMPPRAFDEAVIERQGRVIEAEVRRALHVGVAAEDVGAGARRADIAGGEAGDAEGAHVGGADGVLGGAHAPDDGRRLLRREQLGDAPQLRAGHARDALHLLRIPLGDFLADILHAVDALADELLVLPAVLEDVPEQAPDERDVGAGAEADVFGGMGRGAREARIAHDHVAAVDLLRGEQVLHRDRVRFGGVAADEEHGLGVADVVVGIGLRAVAPGIGDARHRRRMADARLVVDRVRPPEGGELPEQIGALVRELGRAQPEHGIGAPLVADDPSAYRRSR